MSKWYGPIEVNGKRPAWLADDDQVRLSYDDTGGRYLAITRYITWEGPAARPVKAISITADHWAVAPLKARYEPWAGGERAPDDWDGKGVYYRNGTTEDESSEPNDWRRHKGGMKVGYWDIIGYRKRAEPQTEALQQAINLLQALHTKHWPDAEPIWPHGTLMGVLSQLERLTDDLERRETTVRAVAERLRTLPLPQPWCDDSREHFATLLEREALPMSDVERMAREMHAQSMAGITPWERLTDWTREGWLKTAKWAIEHGARMGA